MKISVMLLPARVDVFRRHVHPSRVVASCLRWRKSQHCATARRRVAELEMIELDGVEDDDIMKLRIVVFNMMERRLAKTSSFFQE